MAANNFDRLLPTSSGIGEFKNPYDVAIDGTGNIYVVDSGNNRIQKFSKNGTLITKWGRYGTGDGEFNFPHGIAINDLGEVYIVEYNNNRIQKFSASGKFLAKWGTKGSYDYEFDGPMQIAIDTNRNVYISDYGNDRIQVFNQNGDFIKNWDKVNPGAIAIDKNTNNIYVTSQYPRRVEKFDSLGNFLTSWGHSGDDDGGFAIPSGITVDIYGNVFVSDISNNNIQKFTSTGEFVYRWIRGNYTNPQISGPRGMSSDAAGNIYVASTGGNNFKDGILCNSDIDGDGIPNDEDAFPLNSNEWLDTDNDGKGNNADSDDDNDGYNDTIDAFPLDANEWLDTDGDGIGDNADTHDNRENVNIINLVQRFYSVVLERTADEAGLNDWVTQLASGSKTGADIAKGFIFSAEFMKRELSDVDFLEVLYRAFFNREADAGGLNGWLNQLESGTSREDVLDGFLNSAEFKNLADSYGIIANATPIELFVIRFYKQTLERSPDEAGLADWVKRLNSGESSGSDVAFGFVFSAEFIARNLNNTDYLAVLYKAFFAREPDAGGFNGWKTQLDAGVSREDVLQGFLGAPEFANLASEYGIRVD
jgi:streptogramin lyase